MTRINDHLLIQEAGPDVVITNEAEATELVIPAADLWAAAGALNYFAQALTGPREQAPPDPALFDTPGPVPIDRLIRVARIRYLDQRDGGWSPPLEPLEYASELAGLIGQASFPDQLWDDDSLYLHTGAIYNQIIDTPTPDPTVVTADGRPVNLTWMAAYRDALTAAGMAPDLAQRIATEAATHDEPLTFEAFDVTEPRPDPTGDWDRQVRVHFTNPAGESVIYAVWLAG